jgi:hypothetical protein
MTNKIKINSFNYKNKKIIKYLTNKDIIKITNKIIYLKWYNIINKNNRKLILLVIKLFKLTIIRIMITINN